MHKAQPAKVCLLLRVHVCVPLGRKGKPSPSRTSNMPVCVCCKRLGEVGVACRPLPRFGESMAWAEGRLRNMRGIECLLKARGKGPWDRLQVRAQQVARERCQRRARGLGEVHVRAATRPAATPLCSKQNKISQPSTYPTSGATPASHKDTARTVENSHITRPTPA